jgi:hypothetical protein
MVVVFLPWRGICTTSTALVGLVNTRQEGGSEILKTERVELTATGKEAQQK